MTIGSGMPLWPISQKLQEARNISVIFILDLENIKMNNFLRYPSNLFEKSKLVLELILNSLCCICDGMKLLHWNPLVGGLHFSCSYHHENYIVMLKSVFLWATFYDESVGMLDMHCLSELLQIYVLYCSSVCVCSMCAHRKRWIGCHRLYHHSALDTVSPSKHTVHNEEYGIHIQFMIQCILHT